MAEKPEENKDDNSSSSDSEIWELIPPNEMTEKQEIEITLVDNRQFKKRKITKEDRRERQQLHHTHLLTLLSSAILRNKWIQSNDLKTILFEIYESNLLEWNYRELNLNLIKKLSSFWANEFQTFTENCSLDGSKSLIDLLLNYKINNNEISRDVAVMLFVSLLRRLGFATRLITALNVISLSFKSETIDTQKLDIPFVMWAEVFQNDNWLTVDPIKGTVGSLSFKPSSCYILGHSSEYHIKDLTKKYSKYWNAIHKNRIIQSDVIFWLFSKSSQEITPDDQKEDIKLLKHEINDKMPTSLSGFLNHPLYCLEKQLKLYELIDPLQKRIGIFKNQNVYPRNSVKVLMNPRQWLRNGRLVDSNQTPAKVIKRKNKGKMEDDLEESFGGTENLFGEWQTVEYPRPSLIDGDFPLNKYGNIEIFHENMIPLKTSHLKNPKYQKIAEKLNVSYCKVVAGYEYKSKIVQPKFEGILVKEEDVEVVKIEFEYSAKKDEEMIKKRKEKRVYERWRKVILGLQLKDRLEKDYL